MHELGIAAALLDAIRVEVAKHPGGRASRVGIRIGEISGVDPDALGFSFECLLSDSGLAPLQLEIETCPRIQKCSSCGHRFDVVDLDTRCPSCAERLTECVGGTELDLAWLEVERP
ncbi:MAG: hydrogenase maturation nickel metallochaperone HypA [Thermoanaerobaculia bacterium]